MQSEFFGFFLVAVSPKERSILCKGQSNEYERAIFAYHGDFQAAKTVLFKCRNFVLLKAEILKKIKKRKQKKLPFFAGILGIFPKQKFFAWINSLKLG